MKIQIIGRRFNDTATYYDWDTEKEFARYDLVSTEEFEIDADTLADGKKWLAKNHPDMYMGSNIICENGDFSCLAVPCGEYGKGNYETTEARVAWVTRCATN